MRPVRVTIFAKAPRAGFAKTRLIPALGADGAAELARRMLDKTLSSALAAGLGPVELCVTPEFEAPDWRYFHLPFGVEVTAQGEGDLGARLTHAAQRAVDNGEAVMLIGTDCVEMSAKLLCDAAAALLDTGTVIHSTADGGYVLLGLTRSDPYLFTNMAWSTNRVAYTTIARIGRLGWPLHVGSMLHDIDEPEDLQRLPADWAAHS